MEQANIQKKAVLPIFLAVLQVIAVLLLIFVNFMAGGYSEGLFDIEDVLFNGISSLANKSDYELFVEAGRTYSFLVLMVIGGGLLAVLLRGKAREQLQGSLWRRIAVQVATNALLLFFSLMIVLYSFQGLTRCLLYVAVVCSAALYLLVTVRFSVRVGATALLIHLIAFLAAFFLAWFFAPLFGGIYCILGDIASFVVVLCLIFGGGTYWTRVVRVWVI